MAAPSRLTSCVRDRFSENHEGLANYRLGCARLRARRRLPDLERLAIEGLHVDEVRLVRYCSRSNRRTSYRTVDRELSEPGAGSTSRSRAEPPRKILLALECRYSGEEPHSAVPAVAR